MYKEDDIICYCMEITYKQIKDAILDGARSVEEISDITDAGISCGTCIEDLEIIFEALSKE